MGLLGSRLRSLGGSVDVHVDAGQWACWAHACARSAGASTSTSTRGNGQVEANLGLKPTVASADAGYYADSRLLDQRLEGSICTTHNLLKLWRSGMLEYRTCRCITIRPRPTPASNILAFQHSSIWH